MTDLIKQIVTAKEASKALNREIALAVGWVRLTPSEGRKKYPTWFHPDDCRDGRPVYDSLHGTDVWREPLNYTGSLDAAETLIPAGLHWTGQRDRDGGVVSVGKADSDARGIFYTNCHQATAKSLALALCAAALKAKGNSK